MQFESRKTSKRPQWMKLIIILQRAIALMQMVMSRANRMDRDRERESEEDDASDEQI